MAKDVIAIASIGKTFKNSKELQEYCDNQYKTLEASLERVKKLEDEVVHLKDLLTSASQLIQSAEKLSSVSNELLICESQLAFLYKTSAKRELTLEETKKLDLLVKNLRLLQGKSTSIEAEFRNMSDESLLQIASTSSTLGEYER